MTLREVLTARFDRAKQRLARAKDEMRAAEADMEACRVALKGLTPAQETWLESLCDMGVLKAQD